MNLNSRSMKHATGLWSVLAIGFLLAGCSQSAAPGSNQAPQTSNETAATAAAPAPPMQSVAAPYTASANGQYEEPPVVNVADLLPATPLSGPGYTVQPQAPTNGAMGQYTIVADPSVFHDDAGTYYVESLDMLKIRLSEIPAIAELDSMSNTDVFAKALATSAVRPVTAATNMVMHPMDTVTGLPGGIGDLFGRVSLGAETIASSASNSFGSGKAAGQAGNATITALGYDQMRRQLAHKLHVDPYSSDPILTKKLNSVAWVMFSARMTVNVAMMAVPGSMIISAVTITNDLVYQTPRADLIILVQKKLKSFGLSQEEIVTFSTNTAIPLSLQVDAVKDLEALGDIPGRRAAAVDIGNMMTEYQARFLVTSLHMLVQWSHQQSPITGIKAPGPLIARDQNGSVIMPAPVDYLSWTPRIAGFATDPSLMAMHHRVIWITGKITPLARQQLGANGWSVRQGQ
jgi:hypothetical protein